uniref:Uncharacterized protein n=1 Tax=Panagrolaimus sp. PS1159 TaxID=55785 RepID=A0AC35EXS2_9BILA
MNLCPPNFTAETLIEKALEKKYITCSVYEAGGFGNQIWRFASLYGLGRFTGREPYFEILPFQNAFTKTDLHLMDLSEIGQIFPLMHELLNIKNPPPWLGRGINFAQDCCKFDNPK